jgi:hypothetical protein
MPTPAAMRAGIHRFEVNSAVIPAIARSQQTEPVSSTFTIVRSDRSGLKTRAGPLQSVFKPRHCGVLRPRGGCCLDKPSAADYDSRSTLEERLADDPVTFRKG